MNLSVLDHHLDADEGVYRLVIGYPVEHVIPMVDEEGNQLRGPDVPLTNEAGETMMRALPVEEGADPTADPELVPIMVPGEAMLETVVELVPTEDFVFAADDERWEGMSPEEVAEAQRELVKGALLMRQHEANQAAEAQAAARTELPGAGEAL